MEDERIKRLLPYIFYAFMDIMFDEIKYISYKSIVNDSDQLRFENVYTTLEV